MAERVRWTRTDEQKEGATAEEQAWVNQKRGKHQQLITTRVRRPIDLSNSHLLDAILHGKRDKGLCQIPVHLV